jgi:hypothetical protein
MNDIAAGLGRFVCQTAFDLGLAGAHCYNAAAQQQLGYSAMALLIVAAAMGFRRITRSA